jgi:hypothetical protein
VVKFHSGPGTLWAEAQSSRELGEERLTVRLRNHTLKPLEMSFVSDEYIAQLKDGSLEPLNKLDFFNYPVALAEGQEQAIRLGLPKKYRVADIIALILRLERRRTVLALNPTQGWPAASHIAMPPHAPVVPAIEPLPLVAMPPTALSEPPAAASLLQLPPADVPVVVEFTQEFGGMLTLQVTWDDGAQTEVVRPGERKVFRVAPGPHVCTLKSEVPGLRSTMGQVPLVVAAHTPVRIIAQASVTLSGARLHVETWDNVANNLLLERTFEPGA